MIYKPDKLNFTNKNIVMIIAGLPGVGKTTLALSAPDCVLIDCDDGIVRVDPRHRRDTSVCAKYEDLLADVKAFEGNYKTVVIDTGGALVDLLKDWAIRNEPSASKKSGGFSQQGYGFIKTEFLRLFAELRKKYNVVMLFHATKDRQNDDLFYDIVCEGSAKTLVWQPADLGAFMFIQDGKRYLGFTPTQNYNAKSAYGIKGLVEVPELGDGDANDFLEKLFEKVKANIAAESASLGEDQKKYDEAMASVHKIIDKVSKPEHVKGALDMIAKIPHALTSEKEGKKLLKDKLAELGITYDKAAKEYVFKGE